MIAIFGCRRRRCCYDDRLVMGCNVLAGIRTHKNTHGHCINKQNETTGARNIKRDKIRADMTKIVVQPDGRKACPRFDQVRLVAYHHIQAKVCDTHVVVVVESATLHPEKPAMHLLCRGR
jgi:hypothetical protein